MVGQGNLALQRCHQLKTGRNQWDSDTAYCPEESGKHWPSKKANNQLAMHVTRNQNQVQKHKNFGGENGNKRSGLMSQSLIYFTVSDGRWLVKGLEHRQHSGGLSTFVVAFLQTEI